MTLQQQQQQHPMQTTGGSTKANDSRLERRLTTNERHANRPAGDLSAVASFSFV